MNNISTELLPASSSDIYPDNLVLSAEQEEQLIYQLTNFVNKNVAKAIQKLDKLGYAAYLKIINDNGLVIAINNMLNTENEDIITEMLGLHHTIITENFDILIENLFKMEHFKNRLKSLILFRLLNIEAPVPLNIYRAIYDCALYEVDKAKHNSSLIIETPANVHISQEIESLDILKYDLLLNYFYDFIHFAKDSASESIVFSAKFLSQMCTVNQLKKIDLLLNRRIFFKIFPIGELTTRFGANGKYNTSGLLIETSIYEELRKLVQFGVTPNILCSVYNGRINNFDTKFINNPIIDPAFRAACIKNIKAINTANNLQNPNTIWNQPGIVMTIPGDEILARVIVGCTNAERKEIMFQIIYTLYVFDELQISHGDLHNGNIFIQNIPPKTLHFNILGHHFRFTTTKLVKIYDFDHASICKNSNIRLDVNDSFTINSVLNPNRAEDGYFNLTSAETNIYNKQLDLIILICYALGNGLSQADYLNFNFFNNIDIEFNNFLRTAMPGFYNDNPLSNYTIRDTYLYYIRNSEPHRLEASRIFNIDIDAIHMGPRMFDIHNTILHMNWKQYSLYIREHYGRIVKSFNSIPNNQLWIPDEIVMDKSNMLLSAYFAEYIIAEPFNVTKGTVYSIQNRLLA